MNRAHQLHSFGQSLRLDNITRELLDNGGLRRYVEEYSITGLTFNPTIFDHAIGNTFAYDLSIREKARDGAACDAIAAGRRGGFARSWRELMERIALKSATLARVRKARA